MTRDRAAVKKIVLYAIKNNARVIVAPGERRRGPGRGGLERAEAEDAIDRIEAGNDPLSNEIAQGLRSAAAQGAVAGAAIESRDRELVGKTVAAMHLYGVAGDTQCHLVAGHLGGRRQERIGERVGGGAGAVEDPARRLDVAVHLGDLPTHPLEIPNRTPEGAALLDVFDRFLERALGERLSEIWASGGGGQLAAEREA